MNRFTDQAIILNARPHGEAGAIVSVLTAGYGRRSAYVNGAQSSTRLRSMLQSGQCVTIEWTSRTEGQLGRFEIEPEKDIAGMLLDEPKKITAIQSLTSLADMFLPEGEKHPALYEGTRAFVDFLCRDEWMVAYIYWELAFLKELGYGIDLSKCVVTGGTDNLTHVSPKTGRAVCAPEAAPYAGKLLAIPSFMQGQGLADDDISTGLRLTGYFLIHRLLTQSSYQTLPEARINLENTFDLTKMDA